jgi:putative transposase
MQLRTHLPKYNIGAHFLTAKTFQNIPFFREPVCARIFCEELEAARTAYGFHVLAFVVMPDHVHLLLWWDTDRLPDLTISKVAWAVKGRSARRMVVYLKRVGEGIAFTHPGTLLQSVRKPADRPHHRNWRYKIWQQGAGYDFNVYAPHKLVEKVAYIHANPVRAGLAANPGDYPWSSAVNYAGVGEGIAFGHPGHPVQITLYSEVL